MTSEQLLKNYDEPLCIIGNGKIENKGKIIDSYKTVIRFNNFKINGFEKDVGTKTSLRCVNGYGKTLKVYDNIISFSPFLENDKESKFANLYDGDIIFASDTYKYGLIHPSTGFTLIIMLVTLGYKFDLYGFDFFESGHYYDATHKSTMHNAKKEKEILHKLKIIN